MPMVDCTCGEIDTTCRGGREGGRVGGERERERERGREGWRVGERYKYKPLLKTPAAVLPPQFAQRPTDSESLQPKPRYWFHPQRTPSCKSACSHSSYHTAVAGRPTEAEIQRGRS